MKNIAGLKLKILLALIRLRLGFCTTTFFA
jgi:hypothetical protein